MLHATMYANPSSGRDQLNRYWRSMPYDVQQLTEEQITARADERVPLGCTLVVIDGGALPPRVASV